MVLLAAIMIVVILGGWLLGSTIHTIAPGTGLQRFLTECAIWLLVVAVGTSPLLIRRVRKYGLAALPN